MKLTFDAQSHLARCMSRGVWNTALTRHPWDKSRSPTWRSTLEPVWWLFGLILSTWVSRNSLDWMISDKDVTA